MFLGLHGHIQIKLALIAGKEMQKLFHLNATDWTSLSATKSCLPVSVTPHGKISPDRRVVGNILPLLCHLAHLCSELPTIDSHWRGVPYHRVNCLCRPDQVSYSSKAFECFGVVRSDIVSVSALAQKEDTLNSDVVLWTNTSSSPLN